MFTYFNNKAIRNLVVAFGSLFNNMYVRRFNADGSIKQSIRVPLAYGSKEKYIRILEEGGGIRNEDGEIVQMTLPRMSFELTNMSYDSSRKRQTILKHRQIPQESSESAGYSYSEVPYQFTFELYIMSKFMDEALQIVEQILPYFTPEFTVTLNPTNVHKKVDVPIYLSSVSSTDDYEGSLDTRRLITYTLTFTVNSYVYGRIYSQGTIRRIFATLFDMNDVTDGLTSPYPGVSSGVPVNYGLTLDPNGISDGMALSMVDIGVSGPNATVDDFDSVVTIRPYGFTSGFITAFGDIIE